jgi:4-oxalomesaconate tautomerase
MSVEHPSGEFTVRLEVAGPDDAPRVERVGLLRTARLLFDGTAYVPETVCAPVRKVAAE